MKVNFRFSRGHFSYKQILLFCLLFDRIYQHVKNAYSNNTWNTWKKNTLQYDIAPSQEANWFPMVLCGEMLCGTQLQCYNKLQNALYVIHLTGV